MFQLHACTASNAELRGSPPESRDLTGGTELEFDVAGTSVSDVTSKTSGSSFGVGVYPESSVTESRLKELGAQTCSLHSKAAR